MKITDFVKERNNVAHFHRYRLGTLYYRVLNTENGLVYEFTIPTDDLGHATVNRSEPAITLMRYIRQALQNGELVAVGD